MRDVEILAEEGNHKGYCRDLSEEKMQLLTVPGLVLTDTLGPINPPNMWNSAFRTVLQAACSNPTIPASQNRERNTTAEKVGVVCTLLKRDTLGVSINKGGFDMGHDLVCTTCSGLRSRKG